MEIRKAIRTVALWIPRAWVLSAANYASRLLEVASNDGKDLKLFRILIGPARGLLFYLPTAQRWMAVSFSLRLNEPEVSDALRRLCRPGSVVFDVGASLGYHTLPLSRLVGPTGQVYAFEAHSVAATILHRTILRNRIQNVSVQRYAVADGTGKAEFSYLGPIDGLAHLTQVQSGTPEMASDRQRDIVSTISLDEFVRQNHIKEVDLIKMDIEGAELLALKGIEKTVLNMRPTIVCEFNGSLRLQEGTDLLRQYGYDCQILTPGPSFNVLAVHPERSRPA